MFPSSFLYSFDFASIVCIVISNVAVGDSNVGLMSTCISILSELLQWLVILH